jgi:NAD(P)H dehydrogenase (quinone)
MTPSKVLVAGETRDTGRATVNELLARGHQVRAMAHGLDARSRNRKRPAGAAGGFRPTE